MLPNRLKNSAILTHRLHSEGVFSQQLQERGITTFFEALRYVNDLPYRRNTDRADYRLVLTEQCGVCTTKHALLTMLAAEETLPMEMMVGMIKMKAVDFPCLQSLLEEGGIAYFPEAHCYLMIEGYRVDATFPGGIRCLSSKRLLYEEPISPDKIGDDRVQKHRAFLSTWLQAEHPHLSLEAVWDIRERSIEALSAC